jgi:hypothetical protein
MPGGGGGGDTMQTSKSNGEQVTGPNPYLAPQLQKIGNAAFDWTNQNMTAPGYFPGGTVGPQGAQTISANTGLAQRGANQLGYGLNDASKQELFDTISGNYLDLASNPGARASLEASFRPQTENLMNNVIPGIAGTFAGSGRTGGGAHFDTTMRGVNDLSRAQADATAKMYQGERANQFAAMGMLPQFQQMDYQDLMAQAQAGANNDAYSQRLMDDKNAKYEYDNASQLDWYNKLSQSLQGMYPGGQQIGWQTGISQGSGGGGGGGGQGMQLAGAGIAAAGSIAAAFI